MSKTEPSNFKFQQKVEAIVIKRTPEEAQKAIEALKAKETKDKEEKDESML